MAKKRHLSIDSIIGDDVMTPAASSSSPSGAPVGKHLAQSHLKAKDTIDKLTADLGQERDKHAQEVGRLREQIDDLKASGRDSGDVEQSMKKLRLEAELREKSLLEELNHKKEELAQLEQKLEDSPDEGVFKLDPNRVRRSKFANRNQLAFDDPEFHRDLASIKARNGNEVAAKVRPVTDDPDYDYEVVYGHRRHHATKLAGTPFYAQVEELTDAELVELMHIENQRVNLSAFEEGAQFHQWLDEGLYENPTRLAEDIGESKSFVSQRMAIHQTLPEVVFTALRDPRRLGITAWRELCAAYRAFPDQITAVATELTADINEYTQTSESDVRALFQKMIKATKPAATAKKIQAVSTPSGVPLFSAEKRASGYLVRFDSAGVAEDVQEEALKKLEAYLVELLGGTKKHR